MLCYELQGFFFADSKFNFWANKYCWHCHFLLVSMLHTLHTLRRILMVGLYWSLSSEHHKKNHLLFSAHGNPCFHSNSGKGGPCTYSTHWDGEFLEEVVTHTGWFQPLKTTFFFMENRQDALLSASARKKINWNIISEITCSILSGCSSVIFHQVSLVDCY